MQFEPPTLRTEDEALPVMRGPAPSPAARRFAEIPDAIDLREYWEVLLRRRALFLGTVLTVLTLVTVYNFLLPPIYRASATLIIEPPRSEVMQGDSKSSLSYWEFDEYYGTQYEIVRSNSVLDQVVAVADLASDPEFRDASNVREAFKERIAVEPLRGSQLVRIAVESEDAEKAAEWANLLSRTFADHNLEDRKAAVQDAFTWLSEQIAVMQAKVEKSELKLLEFKGQEDIVNLERRQTLLEERLGDLAGQHNEATNKSLELETTLNEIRGLQRSPEMVESLPRVLENTLVQKLKQELSDLDSEVARLSQRYKPKHPEILSRQSQIDSVKERLEAEIGKIIKSLEIEYRILKAKEESIRQSLDSVKRESMELSQQAITYGVLKRDAESNRQIYDVLLQRLKETDISGNFAGNNIRILDEATVPSRPFRPRKRRNVLLAGLFGVFLAVGICFGAEQLDNTLKTESDVATYLHEEALATIPRDKKGLEVETPAAVRSAYDSAKTALSLYKREHILRTLLVTSTLRGEGKTTTVYHLGLAFAHAGFRTLLLDADMFQARLCKLVGVPQSPGLSNFFAPGTDLEDIVRPTSIPNLRIVPAGLIPPNPAAPLASDRLRETLSTLQQHFDLVLVDSPPTSAVSEVAFLAGAVDGVLLVAKARSTPRAMIQRELRRMRSARAKIIGVLLTNGETAGSSRSRHDPGYYYYRPEATRGQEEGPRTAAQK